MLITTVLLSGASDYDSHMEMNTSTTNAYISLTREYNLFSDPTPAHGLLDHVKDRKASIKWKWNERDYNSQERKYVPPTSVKISCDTTKFLELPFFGPHTKPHGVR